MSQLRTELTEAEFVHFAALYEIKNERAKREMERSRRNR